jgi:RimJ/RimL family protein N-acetyltransferase
MAVVVPPTAPRYPEELECDATTTLGTTVHVRPIRPDDTSRLVAFHGGLSARSIYRRFFSPHPRLSEDEVKRFTCVDYVNRFAFVAEEGDRLVGVARYDRTPGTISAEVAFVVADEFQHHGIATLLLELLANAAWRSGITRFYASTLAENREMLGVFLDSRFEVTTHLEGGIIDVCFPIGPSCNRHARARKG